MTGVVQVRLVIKDGLLLELLVTWLSPSTVPAERALPCLALSLPLRLYMT